MSSVPMGSMCTIGLRLTRPSRSAVSSPSLWAIQAWADSWTDRLNSSTTYVVSPRARLSDVISGNRPPEEPAILARGRVSGGPV